MKLGCSFTESALHNQDVLDAGRWREFARGEPLTVKMKKAVVIFGPNKEHDYVDELNNAIDRKMEQRKSTGAHHT